MAAEGVCSAPSISECLMPRGSCAQVIVNFEHKCLPLTPHCTFVNPYQQSVIRQLGPTGSSYAWRASFAKPTSSRLAKKHTSQLGHFLRWLLVQGPPPLVKLIVSDNTPERRGCPASSEPLVNPLVSDNTPGRRGCCAYFSATCQFPCISQHTWKERMSCVFSAFSPYRQRMRCCMRMPNRPSRPAASSAGAGGHFSPSPPPPAL